MVKALGHGPAKVQQRVDGPETSLYKTATVLAYREEGICGSGGYRNARCLCRGDQPLFDLDGGGGVPSCRETEKYNDMEAAEKLVVSNLRFVVKIAHEYRNYGIKLADLVQEGNIGLMHAVKKFDPYRGYRLISYAVWWIRAYIQNYIIKSWSLVKIGTTQAQRKLFFKLGQARKKLESLSEKRAEFAEIAETLGVRPEEIAEMDVRMSGAISSSMPAWARMGIPRTWTIWPMAGRTRRRR